MVETNGRNFDLLTLGQVLLRLSPPDNERLSRGDTFVKQVGGAELNVAVRAALVTGGFFLSVDAVPVLFCVYDGHRLELLCRALSGISYG